MQLHVVTLAFCTALAGLMMCINMTVLYRASPRERCLLDWAVAGALFSLGNFIDTFVFSLPYFVSPALSNTAYAISLLFIGQGVRRYLNLKPQWLLVLVIAAALYAVHYWPALQHSTRLRVSTVTMFAGLLLWHPAYVLWRYVDEGTRDARLLLSAILACYSALVIMRAVGFIMQPDTPGFFTTEPVQVISYIIDICFVSSVMLACAALVFRHQEMRLQALVRVDPLTGLYNRFSLAEFVHREILRAQRYHLPLSVLVLDLDYFKRINDEHGHDGGDAVLRELAVCLRESLRDSDMAFRIGGEEFLIWLPNTDEALAQQVAERMCKMVRERAIGFGEVSIRCTVSIGVTQWQSGDSHWEKTFGRADTALYEAKAAGRDRVVCAKFSSQAQTEKTV